MKQTTSWLFAALALAACGSDKKMCKAEPLAAEWQPYADVIDGKDRVVCGARDSGQKVYFKGMTEDQALTDVLRGFEGKPAWTIAHVDRKLKTAEHRHADGTLIIVSVNENDNGTQALFETRKPR